MLYNGVKRLEEYWDARKRGDGSKSPERNLDVSDTPNAKPTKLVDYNPSQSLVVEERKQKESDDEVDLPEPMSAKVGMTKTYSQQPKTDIKFSAPLDLDSDETPDFEKAGEDLEPIPIKIITPEKSPSEADNKLKTKSPATCMNSSNVSFDLTNIEL